MHGHPHTHTCIGIKKRKKKEDRVGRGIYIHTYKYIYLLTEHTAGYIHIPKVRHVSEEVELVCDDGEACGLHEVEAGGGNQVPGGHEVLQLLCWINRPADIAIYKNI